MKIWKKAGVVLFTTILLAGCSDNNTTTESSTEYSDAVRDTSTSSVSSSATTNQIGSESKIIGIMSQMMNSMKGMNMTGDFDIDFANMMIGHHKGAVEMSEDELESGKDETMKRLAQKIKTSNQEEIDQLQKFLKDYKASNMKHGEGELQSMMNKMENEMKNMRSAGDTDRDFAMMMTKHHEDGIAMAKKELEHGMSSQLKKIAQKTIDESNKEIKEMREWMNAKK